MNLHNLNILITWNNKIVVKGFVKFEDEDLITNKISDELSLMESIIKKGIEKKSKEKNSTEWAESWSGLANIIIILDDFELMRTKTKLYTTMFSLPYTISELSTALLRSLDTLMKLKKINLTNKARRGSNIV